MYGWYLGHATLGNFEIFVLINAISSVLRDNLSCLIALKSSFCNKLKKDLKHLH